MDGQFESFRSCATDLGINMNVAYRDEHVPEIERRIRTVKERIRATYSTLLFNKIPY